MRKLLAALLCLALLLTSAALADALPAAEEAAPLPQVGDVVYGFEAVEIREAPVVGAVAVLFEHQKTGAKLMYIANDDTNRVFDLTFLTRPTDNTGLPHVFEHSTLDGSVKYPSRDLFFNLSYQTYNTYMNALTYSVMTTYPIASLSEAQLLKYADYYTDSCLHPMVLEDESIYREEAWRYRLESEDGELTIEGTVYSEMLGANTLARAASFNAYRATFPGSVVGFDQGGDPDDIPDMTWESLKNYHSLFYHPSNTIAFLYGQFEDYTAFLQLLDEAYAPYDRETFDFEDSAYTPITEPVVVKQGFPTEEGSSTENQTTIIYNIVCPGLKADAEEELVANTLTDLLVAGSSPLMQQLKKALPTGNFSIYIDTTAPDDAISISATNVNENDAELFKATVDAALAEVAEKGFDQQMVDGVMSSTQLTVKLTTESSDIGVDLIPNIAYTYATDGNPFGYLDYVDALGQMDAWNQAGRYQAVIEKYLLNSQTTALVTTFPMPGEKEVKDSHLAAVLAEVKASMSAEEKQALIEAAQAEEAATEDEAEEVDEVAAAAAQSQVAQLQAVTVASLPEEIKEYDITDDTAEDGIRRVTAVAGVEGVGQTVLLLDAQGLPQDNIHYFKLFTDLVGEMDTSAHTKEELDVLGQRYLYNGEIRLSLLGDAESYHPYLRMGWIAMDDDLSAGYDLMYELVFDTQLDNVEKLTEQVAAGKAAARSTINSRAYNILLYRALAVTNPLYRYYNYFNYIEYYQFLEQVEQQLQADPAVVVENLQAVQNYFRNSTNAITAFAGNAQSIAVNAPLADAFLAKLGQADITPVNYDLPVPASREALIVDSNVQFNALIADYATLGLEDYDAGLDAISALVGDVYLVPKLRKELGVYSPWTGATQDGGVYLLTYRDPNVRETFAVYEALPAYITEKLDVDQDTLDGYILSSYASYAKNDGELSGAVSAILSLLNGDPADQKLTYMRQLKAVTPEAVAASADMYAKLVADGVRSTAGSAAAINANADLYDAILNPFNAKDNSQVELTDVVPGSEHYDAVRFAFEQGFMTAESDTAFGVDSNATVADFLAAVFLGVGGPANSPEECREWLAGYGLVPADLDLSTPLTEAFACDIVNALGAPITTDTPDLVMTRGELADFVLMLFGEDDEAEAAEEAADTAEAAEETPAAEAEAEDDAATATDLAAVDFTDVPEGHDAYEAVQFVTGLEIMAPLTADTFGVDEEATVGQLADTLIALILDETPAEEARALLPMFGLLPEDADDAAPLTVKALDDSLAALAELAQFPYESIGQDEAQVLKRGQVAIVLHSVLAPLFTAE